MVWTIVENPTEYVREVLSREASEIPRDLIDSVPWSQQMMRLPDLQINEAMILDHDNQAVHCLRRDRFVSRMCSGESMPPLIALGAGRALVDGYARVRALRALRVEEAAVLVQRFGTHG